MGGVVEGRIQNGLPHRGEPPETLAAREPAAVSAGRLEMDRLAELGLVNPRWVHHVAAAVNWPGYEEAVYWFIAHTTSRWESTLRGTEDVDDVDDDGEIAEKQEAKPENPWEQIVKARTNLTAEQRADGLIDVA